ncbi:hypothetical protein MTBLM5_50144 [Magnetospirillum sp. LM-5]|nr:hypothetical protein MTBLM5_50144 [Magnetospirillum sp. LM-5]
MAGSVGARGGTGGCENSVSAFPPGAGSGSTVTEGGGGTAVTRPGGTGGAGGGGAGTMTWGLDAGSGARGASTCGAGLVPVSQGGKSAC